MRQQRTEVLHLQAEERAHEVLVVALADGVHVHVHSLREDTMRFTRPETSLSARSRTEALKDVREILVMA